MNSLLISRRGEFMLKSEARYVPMISLEVGTILPPNFVLLFPRTYVNYEKG